MNEPLRVVLDSICRFLEPWPQHRRVRRMTGTQVAISRVLAPPAAVDPRDPFLIVNTATDTPLESWPQRWQAEHFCAGANDLEIRAQRRPVYIVREVAKW